jgi:ankyrin repeat protein
MKSGKWQEKESDLLIRERTTKQQPDTRKVVPKSARSLQLEDFDATLDKSAVGGSNDDDDDTSMSKTESHYSEGHLSGAAFLIDRGLIEKATEAAIYKIIQEDAEEQCSSEDEDLDTKPRAIDEQSSEDRDNNHGRVAYSTKLVHELYRLVLETEPDEGGAVDPLKWELIRSYLLSGPDLTKRAASIRNAGGLTPFHQVCRHRPPMDVIELFISCIGFYILTLSDNKGNLPIHHACATNASPELINALVELYPESKVKQDASGATPLHFIVANPDLNMIALAAICTEGSASIADRHGMLPLHYAVLLRKFSKPEVVKLLVESYPRSLTTEDLKGRVPIRWLSKSCHLDDSLELLEFSFSLDPTLGKGDMGLLLLSHLEECAKKNRNSVNVQQFLDLLRSNNPEPSEAYKSGLKRLPRWLNKTDKPSRRRNPFRREKK